MTGSLDPSRPGGVPSARALLLALSSGFLILLASPQATPAHAAWTAFVITMTLSAWIMSRGALEGITIERRHRPRVFENDIVPVSLVVRQSRGLAQSLVVVEDQFPASLSVRQRHLIPLMSPRWEAHLHYYKEAERHRGLYMLGPARLWAADPLGVFFRSAEADTMTTLTVYPKAVPLGGYKFLGADPPAGMGIETSQRIGHGEEIIGVRPYRSGDPMNRIHWRTSIRRGVMHVVQTDTHVQIETALFLDLTRRSRYGTGAESTTETTIGCATSILTEASALRHRISLAWVQREVESFPAGAGLAHLHLLLDRLAVVSFGGESHFWNEIAPRAALLTRGSKAIFIAPAATTPVEEACALIRQLILKGVAVDVILIDESQLMRVWRDQSPPLFEAPLIFNRLVRELERAGARVLPLSRSQGADHLLPAAAQ